MIDKTIEIKDFIKKNYCPGNILNTQRELQLTTLEVMDMVFQIFPMGCIDDYEMHQILVDLDYVPQKKGLSEFVWCLISVD